MTIAVLEPELNDERLTDRDFTKSTGSRTLRRRTILFEGEQERRFSFRGGDVTARRNTAHWMIPTTNALVELLSLPTNWDTYGARRIDWTYAQAVLQLMSEVIQENTPLPSFVPTSRGGIQLEWHIRGIDLEIEFVTPTRVHGSYEDLQSGETWEENLSYNLRPLTEAIVRLSARPR